MEITERVSSQGQCAEQKVSQYPKSTLSKRVVSLLEGKQRWGGQVESFKSTGTSKKHTWLSSSPCRSESHLCLCNKTNTKTNYIWLCHYWELRQITAHLLVSAELLIYITMTGQNPLTSTPDKCFPKATTSLHLQCLRCKNWKGTSFHRQLSRSIRFTTVTLNQITADTQSRPYKLLDLPFLIHILPPSSLWSKNTSKHTHKKSNKIAAYLKQIH